jgi:gluconolactonase
MSDFIVIREGFETLEAPTLDGNGLLFSDVTAGGVHRLADDQVEVVVPKRKGVGGIQLHADGGIIVTGRDVCHVVDSRTRPLLTREDVEPDAPGQVGGFNDLVCLPDGRILVGTTRFDQDGNRLPGELVLVEGERRFKRLYGDVVLTNGICLSPDDGEVFHADSYNQRVTVSSFDGQQVQRQREFSTKGTPGYPDGMATDENGNLWIAFHEGHCVAQYSPAGKELNRVPFDGVEVLSLCFATDDRRTAYVVSGPIGPVGERSAKVYRGSFGVGGVPLHACRI